MFYNFTKKKFHNFKFCVNKNHVDVFTAVKPRKHNRALYFGLHKISTLNLKTHHHCTIREEILWNKLLFSLLKLLSRDALTFVGT
jgi:hypothetical protein